MIATDTPQIVVGVDGSPAGHAALMWAYAYASATGGCVELITAWQWPYMYAGFGGMSGMNLAPDYSPTTEAALVLEKGLADSPLPAARTTSTNVSGSAAEHLIAASVHADLLVVGARGHGPIGRMMLGSVSTECTHHAHCPVVVVHAPTSA